MRGDGGAVPLAERCVASTGYGWWAGQDSNLQPDRYERPALTIELPAQVWGAPPGIKRKKPAVAIVARAAAFVGAFGA